MINIIVDDLYYDVNGDRIGAFIEFFWEVYDVETSNRVSETTCSAVARFAPGEFYEGYEVIHYDSYSWRMYVKSTNNLPIKFKRLYKLKSIS